MAVPVELDESFTFGNATELFDAGSSGDVEREPPHLNVVVNWLEELEERVPVE